MKTMDETQIDKVPSQHKGHPCFDPEARSKTARIHLPVAPRCNMQCHYCNRDFDCANESRPGVSAKILSPMEALAYLNTVREKMPNLRVVGIAGPGDPFANAQETMETLRAVHKVHPDLLLCVATNGLAVLPFVDELAELGLSHITFTVNAVDPVVGQAVYSWMRYDKRTHAGVEAASYLWEQQKAGIKAFADKGVTVKINCIAIPGININHIPSVAKACGELGATVFNLMPLKPVKDTVFENLEEPDAQTLSRARLVSAPHMPQVSHCARCRADAVGAIGDVNPEWAVEAMNKAKSDVAAGVLPLVEKPQAIDLSAVQASKTANVGQKPAAACIDPKRPLVAVATREGMLVNRHLGEADRLYLYDPWSGNPAPVDIRATPASGSGDQRWHELAATLKDCSLLLVNGVGNSPKTILAEHGIEVRELEGLIAQAITTIRCGDGLETMKKRAAFKCGDSCAGNGQGCG